MYSYLPLNLKGFLWILATTIVLTHQKGAPHCYGHQDPHGQLEGSVAHLGQLAVLSFESSWAGTHKTCFVESCYWTFAFLYWCPYVLIGVLKFETSIILSDLEDHRDRPVTL